METTNTENTRAILDLVARWATIEQNGDADGLDPLLVDDFLLVGPLGFLLNKEQMLGRYRSGVLKHTSFNIQEPQVREYGSAAVIVASQIQQTTYQDRDASGTFRITLVAIRQGDHWAFASMHLSPIAGPR